VNTAVIKTIESFKETSNEGYRLLSLYKDAEDDKAFVKDLFRKTALNNAEYEELIGKKTQNWEVDRIASMDILIMKMALTELLNFNSIPVKVSLNEYIELSKEYSTPKSKIFVNGILDKLVADLKRENKIMKVGRGLME
jgi:N utilization substance protein B